MNIEINEEQAGIRVDVLLTDILSISRNQIHKMISDKNILINDKVTKKGYVCELGDSIEVFDQPSIILEPNDNPIDIIFEDENILVVDKPVGIVVHPNSVFEKDSLIHRILFKYPEIIDIGDDPMRPGIVHRLDKETSGLIIVAKTQIAFDKLKEMLAERKIQRWYLTIVENIFQNTRGTIDAPIGSSGYKTRKEILVDGKPARTHYWVLDNNETTNKALLKCKLETGRTHQIRLHLYSIGHSVVGDYIYSNSKKDEDLRTMLHAYQLDFEHPITNELLSFTSPVSNDFLNLIETFGLKLSDINPKE